MAKSKKLEKTEANIDFEKKLWDAADEVSGGFCKANSLKEVEAANGMFSPEMYLGIEVEDDGVSFAERTGKLPEELGNQFRKGNREQKEISKNLVLLGYNLETPNFQKHG